MFILLFMICLPLWAKSSIVSQIHAIDPGRKNQPTLVLLESGHVLKIKQLPPFIDRETSFEFEFDKNRNVVKMEQKKNSFVSVQDVPGIISYEPSLIKNGKTTKRYFNESRISRGETQCFNRAHVWSYELWKNHQVKSQKIFLFFSRKYIREHDFGWWFHVAPLLLVDEWSGESEKVIDPRYITAPRSIDWWIGKFISGDPSCQVINHYSQYADYPFSHDCYILKAPMYVYQPLDLEMEETWGTHKNEFSQTDLQWAYKEAFQIDYHGDSL